MIMGLFNKTSDYQKACENKIKELCGGFTPSDYFTEKAYSYKYEKNPTNNNEKAILKDECLNKTLALEDIEKRLDELLHMDCNALNSKIRQKYHRNTSEFKTQKDIDNFLGPSYYIKYHEKLEHKRLKYESEMKKNKQKELEIYTKYNIYQGVTVNVILPEKEIKLKYIDNSLSRGVATKYFGLIGLAIQDEIQQEEVNRTISTQMLVVDNGIVFRNAQKDGKDLRIPYESIISVEPHVNNNLKIILLENQIIYMGFVVVAIWDAVKIQNLINDQFMEIVNQNARGREFEEKGWDEISQNEPTNKVSDADEILKYVELYEHGYLTKEEFEMEKSKILHGKKAILECPNCKTPVNYEDQKFCTNCGTKLN